MENFQESFAKFENVENLELNVIMNNDSDEKKI